MKHWENTAALVTLGSWGYPLLEIIWRGWSHWSMALAGGVCFGLLGQVSERLHKSMLLRCAAGSAAITAVELLFGCVFNLALHLQVWDYSEEWLNLGGQICVRYSLIWFVLSAPVMLAADWLGRDPIRQEKWTGERQYASGNQCTKYLYHAGLLPQGRAEDRDTAGDRAAPHGGSICMCDSGRSESASCRAGANRRNGAVLRCSSVDQGAAHGGGNIVSLPCRDGIRRSQDRTEYED